MSRRFDKIVVMGASAGGLAALGTLLGALPRQFPFPIAIVQHIGPRNGSQFAALLGDKTKLYVMEAEDKAHFESGVVLLAPPGYHLLVEADFTAALSVDPPVRFSRPSIDILFESAADALGDKVIGVILTGANEDGAQGLSAIASRGGVTIVQDPETAESKAMPQAALRAVPKPVILPIVQIAEHLLELAGMATLGT